MAARSGNRSPLFSAPAADDLGEDSNTMFRECITWTEFVPLDEEHHQRLEEFRWIREYGGVRHGKCKSGPQILINKGIYGFPNRKTSFSITRLKNDEFSRTEASRAWSNLFSPMTGCCLVSLKATKAPLCLCQQTNCQNTSRRFLTNTKSSELMALKSRFTATASPRKTKMRWQP